MYPITIAADPVRCRFEVVQLTDHRIKISVTKQKFASQWHLQHVLVAILDNANFEMLTI